MARLSKLTLAVFASNGLFFIVLCHVKCVMFKTNASFKCRLNLTHIFVKCLFCFTIFCFVLLVKPLHHAIKRGQKLKRLTLNVNTLWCVYNVVYMRCVYTHTHTGSLKRLIVDLLVCLSETYVLFHIV